MRSKFLTISALALCCLFAGRSARADLTPASLNTADGFTYSCMQGCGYNAELIHAPLFERDVFSDSFGGRFLKVENPWMHYGPIEPFRFVDARPAVVPAPEPSSLLLTFMGLVGLGLLMKSVQRRRSFSAETAS
jgi:hypothetical protein